MMIFVAFVVVAMTLEMAAGINLYRKTLSMNVNIWRPLLSIALAVGLSACQHNHSAETAPARQVAAAPVKVDLSKVGEIKQTVNPEEVTLFESGTKRTMHYLIPQMRTAVRALGFGGVGQYAVLRGPTASLHIRDRQPIFVFAVPSHAQPESYFTLASFVVRENGTREVIVGGGYMSYSTGVHQDRVVSTSIEQLTDQSKAPKDFTLYAATVNKPLAAGEYALMFYNSQIRSAGFFSAAADSYFDFAVD